MNKEKKTEIIIDGISDYYEKITKFKQLIKRSSSKDVQTQEQIFNLAVEIISFEALTFIIPFIEKDMGMPFGNKEVVKKCIKARVKTEIFFEPDGIMDSYFSKLNFFPGKINGFSVKADEYLIFEDQFINDQNLVSVYKNHPKNQARETEEIKGNTVYKTEKIIKGEAKIVLSKKDFPKFKKGDVLVASGTTPDYMPIIRIASAIITDEGGYLCHAAIVSRELKIAAVVGTGNATKVLKDGDKIEVDAGKGIVRVIK